MTISQEEFNNIVKLVVKAYKEEKDSREKGWILL